MNKARILIVDDEPELCDMLKETLEDQSDNYIISTACSGTEGYSVLKNQEFDVLITDIQMPGMNGIELMEKAKKLRKDLQIIVITGLGDLDSVEALRLGAYNYLKKPVYYEVLHFTVKNAWEKKKETEERRRAEDALRESEKRYRTLFDSASDAIFVHDLEKRLLDANQAACESLGYSHNELVQMTVNDIVLPGNADLMTKRTQALKQNDHIVFESVHVRQDGTHLPVEASSRIIEYGDKKAILTIVRDISERKRAEEEQEKLRIQLRQAQRMESVGTLAGGIAHDFNNILYPIIGYTEMTMDEISADSPARSNLEEVLRASYRATDLVKQILTFSRQREQERVPVKIQYVVKEVMKLLKSTLPATIKTRQSVKDCSPVLADSGQIHQVIMNLCTNAYHAMCEKGGVLDVSLKEAELGIEDIAPCTGMKSGAYLKLTVSDTGYGIGYDVMERIYDPYFTTKEQGKGTGLGLSVVHGIIKNHNGHITVHSTPGKGTTFDIYLPLIADRSDAQAIISQTPDQTGNEKILLVDDEVQIVNMLGQMLERLGYHVTARTSSVEALEAFRNQPEKFNLVITDTTMPNMTGIELAEKLMSIRPDIPVILCTGFSELITKEKAKAMGIREFVMKPVLKKEIARIIRKVLD